MVGKNDSGPLLIGQAAKLGGVNLQALRYYEREGLLPPARRLESGYRVFSDQDVRRVRFIKRAQELGFSLKDIRELFSLQEVNGTGCADVRGMTQARLADVESKIRNLQSIKATLTRLAAACPSQGSLGSCPILDSLNVDPDLR